MVDVGRQSSTLPKSEETKKLKKSMMRLLLAKRKAMKMLENGESSSSSSSEVDVTSKKKVKVEREKKSRKVVESTLADGSEDEDSDAWKIQLKKFFLYSYFYIYH